MSLSWKDSVIRVYEEYILSGKNVDLALKKLIEGTDEYDYLKCLDLLTKKGLQLSAEEKKFIESYIEKPQTEEKQRIKYRYEMMCYDEAKTPEDKSRALDIISKTHFHIQFYHHRPASYIGKISGIQAPKTIKIEPLLDNVDIKAEVSHMSENGRTYRDFTPRALKLLDFKKLDKSEFFDMIRNVGADIYMLTEESFINTLHKHLQEGYASNGLPSGLITHLSLQQLEYLVKPPISLNSIVKCFSSDPQLNEDIQLLTLWVQKKFSRELSAEANVLTEDRRKNLITLYEFSCSQGKHFLGLKLMVLRELLVINLKLNLIEGKYFIEYTKNQFIKFSFGRRSKMSSYEWITPLTYLMDDVKKTMGQANDSDQELFKKYLMYFFIEKKKPMDSFSGSIEKFFLKSVYEEAMIKSGKKIEITTDNKERIDSLLNEVNITLCDHNRELFKIGENISLFVDIKNVPTLFVEIFQINTENYYKKHMKPFQTDISLEGIVASIEKKLEFKQPPQLSTREEIKLPELKGKTGLFIVELIGNGKSSRAIIKIGTLYYKSKPTIAGQQCFILDGNNNICCDETTGIYINNTLFKADLSHKGSIMIPYKTDSILKQALLLHKGFTELVDFPEMEELYLIKCGYTMLPESFLMGNKASILIRPQLFICTRKVDLSLLTNIKCILSTSNYVDDIPTSKVFENLTINSKQELEISFQVNAQAKELHLEFHADVWNASKAESQHLVSKHSFNIIGHTSEMSIGEFYLSLNIDKNYILKVLGKNGEPIPHASVSIDFYCDKLKFPINKISATTNTGEILLGKMNGVTSLKASCLQQFPLSTFSKEWKLPSKKYLQYPKSIDIIENELIELPFTVEKTEDIFLIKRDNSQVLANCTNLIKFSKGTEYKKLEIKGLSVGEYIISGLGNKDIFIQVHKGVYWKKSKILKPFSLLENQKKINFIKINSLKFEEGKELNMNINVNSGKDKNWRLHLMLFRYIPNNINQITKSLKQKKCKQLRESFFQQWDNFYFSNRELSSELKYCFDRRQMEPYTGNTLEKPTLLLKKIYVKDTEEVPQAPNKGTEYAKQTEKRRFQEIFKKKIGFKSTSNTGINPDNTLSLYQNFIGKAPITQYNLPGNETGQITIQIERSVLNEYSMALVMVIGEESVAHHFQPLQIQKEHNRDLSLTAPLSGDKYYSEMRTSTCLSKYDNHRIDDITSTETQLIDSLEKVTLVIKALHRLRNREVTENDKLGKILKWDTMSLAEKNAFWSEHPSHEIHLFIRKKDPEYFETSVRPYLNSKMEKTLFDYLLLGNIDLVLKCIENTADLSTLNALEKVLLIEELIEAKMDAYAQSLVQSMKNEIANYKGSISEQNRVFDTVLSLNMLKTENDKEKCISPQPVCEEPSPSAEPALRGKKQNQHRARSRRLSECEQFEAVERSESFDNSEKDEDQRDISVDSLLHLPSDKRRESVCSSDSDDMDYMTNQRAIQKPSLQEVGSTKEYAETNYYGISYMGPWTSLVENSQFWVDYAEYLLKRSPRGPFLSSAFTEACNNLTEICGVLSLLDLPYTSQEHGFKSVGSRGMEIKLASNSIIFTKEIKESKGNLKTSILVAQRYSDPQSRGNEDEQIEEFLINHVYKGQVIITNISSKKLEFNVLYQIPQGSLPLGLSPYQKSNSLSLDSFSTTSIDYYFYFPVVGKFFHFPANVSINSVVVAKASPGQLTVVKEKSKISEGNLEEVLLTEDTDKILKYLQDNPIDTIQGFNWDQIYYLLTNKSFMEKLISLMREQHIFNSTVWSYSFFHKSNELLLAEYVNSVEGLKRKYGYYFDTKLVTVRPSDSGLRHYDYNPLINPRAHKFANQGSATQNLGERPLILNSTFYRTYKHFIFYMMEKPVFEFEDRMTLIAYLLMMDRVSEAIQHFKTLYHPAISNLTLQYDYMQAYLDFYNGAPEFKIAHEISKKYLDYPMECWRLRFADIQTQLDEYECKKLSAKEEKKISKEEALRSEPQLSFLLEGKKMIIDYQNIVQPLEIKYYLIDLEVLCSRTPFLNNNMDDFSFLYPNFVQRVKLDPATREYHLGIPEDYENKNVVIEISAEGIQRMQTYFSNSMKLQIFEKYGELKVTNEEGKPLQQTYVKVFALAKDGVTSFFYKDGYTDIRGRFDYLSLNASKLSHVQKFALFVETEKNGSLIQECKVPQL